MEKSWLDLSEVRFIIISRGRSATIKSHKIFPYATLVVPESQKKDYEWTGLEIKTCDDSIIGLSLLRNWRIQNFKEEIIIMIDDDIEYCCRCDKCTYEKIEDTETIKLVLLNAAQQAKDIGTFVFGFGQSQDVRKYNPAEPFKLTGWVGGVIGVIGKENSFIDNKFKVDVDFCLEALLNRRVIWKDNRFGFVQIRDRNKGGNALYRTKELVDKEKDKLLKKWGRYIKFKSTMSGEVVSVNVKRRERYDV